MIYCYTKFHALIWSCPIIIAIAIKHEIQTAISWYYILQEKYQCKNRVCECSEQSVTDVFLGFKCKQILKKNEVELSFEEDNVQWRIKFREI
jgi:hypothetical protein